MAQVLLWGTPPKISFQLASIVNQGKLVPDDIIVNLLSMRLQKNALKDETGFMDFQEQQDKLSFPFFLLEEILEKVTEIDLLINLKIREDVLLQKCSGRRICGQCGNNDNVASIFKRWTPSYLHASSSATTKL